MKPFRFLLEMGLCMAAYFVFLAVSLIVLKHWDFSFWVKLPITLAPALPFMATGFVILKHIRTMDELERKIQFEAITISFIGTAFVTFTYGFLENIGFPTFSIFGVWPLMSFFWVLGLIVARVRYA